MSPVTTERLGDMTSLHTRGLEISQAYLRHRDPSSSSPALESMQCTEDSGESGSPGLAVSF